MCIRISPLSLFVFLSFARELFIISSIHLRRSEQYLLCCSSHSGICSPVVLFRSIIENDKIISIDNDEASHSITTMIAQLTRTSYIQRDGRLSLCALWREKICLNCFFSAAECLFSLGEVRHDCIMSFCKYERN
jgi:hypothetical protein